MSSLLQPPPTPMEGSQDMHDKVVSFLQDKFMEDTRDLKEISGECAHIGFLSNGALLKIYWFGQGRVETWVGSRLPKHLNNKKVEIGHVLDALGITDDLYQECNEALSLVIAYGERGERWESPRAVAEVQEGPLIFSCCFVKCTKNIAKESVGATDKDGRVVLNRRNFIYEQ